MSPPAVKVPAEVRGGGVVVTVEPAADGARVTVLAPDRVGLLADAAALFALQRVSVRSARAWSQDDVGVSVWEVAEEHLDAAVLRQRYDAIVVRPDRPEARSPPGRSRGAAERGAKERRQGWRVGRRPARGVVARHGARGAYRRPARRRTPVCAGPGPARPHGPISAHVDTLGPQAVDVFYVQEASAGGSRRHPRRRGRPRRSRRLVGTASIMAPTGVRRADLDERGVGPAGRPG